MSSLHHSHSDAFSNHLKTRKLTSEQIAQINEILASLSEYGEIHLVIQRGELRYINKVESHKAWNDRKESGE